MTPEQIRELGLSHPAVILAKCVTLSDRNQELTDLVGDLNRTILRLRYRYDVD